LKSDGNIIETSCTYCTSMYFLYHWS